MFPWEKNKLSEAIAEAEDGGNFLQSDHPFARLLRGELRGDQQPEAPVPSPQTAQPEAPIPFEETALGKLFGLSKPTAEAAAPDPSNPHVLSGGEILPPSADELPGVPGPQLQPGAPPAPKHTKRDALVRLVTGAGRGALDGLAANADTYARTGRNGGFGGGYSGAIEAPIQRAAQRQQLQRGNLENQLTEAQIANIPLQRAAAVAGLQKTQADTDKARAEANRLPAQKALDEANALKAQFQIVDGVPYRVQQLPWGPMMTPIEGSAMIPLSPELAKLANKDPGSNVPISQALKLADLATKGTTNYTTGEGVFEKNRVTGKTTRLGTAPAIASISLQNGPYMNPIDADGNINPKLKPIIDEVGNYNVPLNTALTRVPAAGKAGFLVALKQAYPDFDDKIYQTAQKTLNSATSGPLGDQLSAYNTALLHANLLKQAAKAIAQHDNRTLNGLENSFQAEFGDSAPLTFEALAHLYTGETTKVIAGGHITDSELGKVGATLGSSNSQKQIMGVLDAYSKAMKSKRDVTKNRIEQGMKGKVALDGPEEGTGWGSKFGGSAH